MLFLVDTMSEFDDRKSESEPPSALWNLNGVRTAVKLGYSTQSHSALSAGQPVCRSVSAAALKALITLFD